MKDSPAPIAKWYLDLTQELALVESMEIKRKSRLITFVKKCLGIEKIAELTPEETTAEFIENVRKKLITPDENGATALQIAALGNNLTVLNALLEGSEAEFPAIFSRSGEHEGAAFAAFFSAAYNGNIDVAKTFLHKCPQDLLADFAAAQNAAGFTALHLAALNNRDD